jgi:hypothetical protein
VRHHPGAGDHPRVGAQHPVHVGPDLDLLGPQPGAEEGGGVIRAPPAERGREPAGGRADETAENGHHALVEQRHELGSKALVRGLVVGLGCPVLRVGHQDRSRVDAAGRDPGVLEGGGHDAAARDLAERDDRVPGSERDLLDDSEGPDDRLELVEERVQAGEQLRLPLGVPDERRHLLVPAPKGADRLLRGRPLAGLDEVGDLEEAVRNLRQRRDHHEPSSLFAVDDPHHAAHRLHVPDRGASELHHDHCEILFLSAHLAPRLPRSPPSEYTKPAGGFGRVGGSWWPLLWLRPSGARGHPADEAHALSRRSLSIGGGVGDLSHLEREYRGGRSPASTRWVIRST